MLAPEPFFEPRGTPFSEYHRIKALGELGHQVDLVTYPIGADVELPNLRIIRSAGLPSDGPERYSGTVPRTGPGATVKSGPTSPYAVPIGSSSLAGMVAMPSFTTWRKTLGKRATWSGSIQTWSRSSASRCSPGGSRSR